ALALEQLVGAVVPDLDRAGPVLARRDLAFERGVRERMVLDVHRKRALAGLHRNALRDGPAEQDAVLLEPEVVVEAACIVALHDEFQRVRALGAPASRERFRRLLWIALPPVCI